MIDSDILIEKTSSIQKCLKRIHDKIQSDVNRVENLDTQEIVILNLQRAVERTIDMGCHIVSKKNLGIPKSVKEVFCLLEQGGWIAHELSTQMQKMVDFRNIAVHDYQIIDLSVLKSILQHHLKDFEQFYTAVIEKARKTSH